MKKDIKEKISEQTLTISDETDSINEDYLANEDNNINLNSD